MTKDRQLSSEEINAHILTTSSLLFQVPGHPQPKGSFDYKGRNRKTGKPLIISQGARALKRWTTDVALMGKSKWHQPIIPRGVPVMIRGLFFMPRPKKHFGRGVEDIIRRIPSSKAPIHMTSTPDADKLARALCDALTGIIFEDDRQVISCLGETTWEAAEPRGWTGALIWVGPCRRLTFWDHPLHPGKPMLPDKRQRGLVPKPYQGVPDHADGS